MLSIKVLSRALAVGACFIFGVTSLGGGVPAQASSQCPAGWTYNAANFTCTITINSSTTVTVPNGTAMTYLIVGGGGGGAPHPTSTGGAGGQVVEASGTVTGPIAVTIAAGGGANAAGGTTSLSGGLVATASGGAAGGSTGNQGTVSSLSGSALTYGQHAPSSSGFQGGNGAGGGGGYQQLQGQGCYFNLYPGRGSKGSLCERGQTSDWDSYYYSGEWVSIAGRSGGSGVVVLQYQVFAVTAFTASTTSPTNSADLTYDLTFTEGADASSVSPSDFTNTGTATGCVFSFSPEAGSVTSMSVTVSGCSEGTVTPRLLASSITSSAGVAGPPVDMDGASVTVDRTPPSAPGAPSFTTAGGTVLPNTLTGTNASASISAPITAGEATGGRAEFYLNGVLIGTDSSISAGDTSVSVSPNLADLAASGDLTVRLFDAAGNSIESSGSTALTVDRSIPSISSFAPTAGQSLNTAADPMSFDLVMSEPISGLSGSAFTNAGTATGCVFTPNASSGTNFTVTVTGCSAGTVQPQLNAGAITDGINPGPAANSSVSGADAVNFVTTAPTGTGVPTLSATSGTLTTLGSTLASSIGNWNDQGDTAATTSHKWQVCSDPADVNSCTDISGATGPTFVPDATLDGAYIRSVTTRTNAAGVSTPQASSMNGPMTRGSQTISFTGASTQTFSTSPMALGGTSSSGLDLTYTSLTPSVCSTSGSQVTMLSSGTCTVEASHAGDSMFLPATPVQQSFTVNRASQSLAITTPSQVVAVGSSIPLAASAPGGGAITYTVTSGGAHCSISGSTLMATGPGDCTVEATIAQDGPYLAATSAPITFQSRIARTASLSVPTGALLSDGSVQVSASLSAGGSPGIYAGPPEVCRASGTTIILIGNGECIVSANADADGTYALAEAVTRIFRVGGAPESPAISGVSLNGTTASVEIAPGGLGAATSIDSYTVTATPRGGGAPITVTCTSTPCSVPGLTPGMQYDFSVVANGRVGQKPVSSAPGNFGPVDVLAPSTISITPPSKRDLNSGSFALDVSNSLGSALPVTFVSDTPRVCTVSGTGRVTVVGDGTCSITAGHSGGVVNGVRYSPASQTISFTVGGSKSDTAGDQASPLGSSGVGTNGANGGSGTGARQSAPDAVVVSIDDDGTAWARARFKEPVNRPTTVVFVIRDASGAVIERIRAEVPAGRRTAKVRLPGFVAGMTVHAYTETDNGRSRATRPVGSYVKAGTIAGSVGQDTLRLAGTRLAQPLFFGPDSAELRQEAKAELDDAVSKLGERGGVVLVSGFVRNGGGDRADQLDLADRRALAVAQYFARHRIPQTIRYSGIGAMTPEIGTPDHRRVEIRWVPNSSGLRSGNG